MCGQDIYANEYPENYCNERYTEDPTYFKTLQLSVQTIGNNALSHSLIDMPFIESPWVKIPHFEFRQCFSYARSLLITFMKTNARSNKRYVHAIIKTFVPTFNDYTYHEFEYWSTTFSPVDILRLKRLMNSFNYRRIISDDSCPHAPLIRVYKPARGHQENLERLFKRFYKSKW
jgi:hypothetical protein